MAKPGDLDGVLDEQGNEAPAPAPEPAEAPEQAPEPEASASDEAHAESDDKPKRTGPAFDSNRPDGFVPKQALQAERARADLYEERLNKLIERYFSQQQQPEQAAPQEEIPDENVDPINTVGWTKKQVQELREMVQPFVQNMQQAQRTQAEERAFQDTLSRAQAQFQSVVQRRPEVNDLYQAVQSKVAEFYAANGTPMHQIPDKVREYEIEVIKWARNEYVPIDQALEMAAARFGVSVQPKAQEQRPAPNRDPETGQFTAAEAEKAARQRESQERNASLSSAPGAPVKKMTAKELASMSEADMWKMFDSVGQTPGAKEFYREMNLRS